MKEKGFTLVELLAVIAILAILVIIALPNVLKMYNNAKKNSFLTEAKTIAQDVSSKYITESMKGNKLTTISNKQNSLDLSGRNIEYEFKLDSNGKIKSMMVYDGTYCVVTIKDYTNLKTSDVKNKCSYDEIHNIVGTLSKNFYEKSGKTDRSLVKSIEFYSDGRTISGAESYDVSEKGDNSIIMYVKQNSEDSSLLDLTLVANGTISFPEDSSKLFTFNRLNWNTTYGNLTSIQFNHSVDTSKVTNMTGMFYDSKVTTLDLSDFDTSKVTSMTGMFNDSKVTTLDLSSFDTSKVTDMGKMFDGSETTEIKGLEKFNTSKVTNMDGMFASSKITSLDLSSFDTSKVTSMTGMFYDSKVTTLDLSSFDTSKVTNMSHMFNGSEATEIKGLEKFNTSNVTNMDCMFASSKITSLDLSSFDTSNVTDMRSMFYNSKVTSLDLSSFDTSKVTDMNRMFWEAKATTGYARTQADADKFNASSDKPSTLTFVVKQ